MAISNSYGLGSTFSFASRPSVTVPGGRLDPALRHLCERWPGPKEINETSPHHQLLMMAFSGY